MFVVLTIDKHAYNYNYVYIAHIHMHTLVVTPWGEWIKELKKIVWKRIINLGKFKGACTCTHFLYKQVFLLDTIVSMSSWYTLNSKTMSWREHWLLYLVVSWWVGKCNVSKFYLPSQRSRWNCHSTTNRNGRDQFSILSNEYKIITCKQNFIHYMALVQQ